MSIRSLFIFFIFSISFICSDDFTDKTKYPTRKSIKGLQPDFQQIDQIYGNEVHGVAMNFVWANWQPYLKQSPCSDGETLFEGYCYIIDAQLVNVIKTYTAQKVVVTGVIYGTPSWCRRKCSIATADIFCAPTKEGSTYFGLFTKFIAYLFNGENGNGRVADFVIHNEVNSIDWFNFGCDSGNCDVGEWTTIYSQSWNAAYDQIRKEQKKAKVLISFEHSFFKELDYLVKEKHAVISVETFLENLIPKLGNREWRLAFHAYPIDLLKPEFGADDYPYITFGNIGVLSGWLHKNYPDKPYTWEIQLTENGINANVESMYEKQKNGLCQAYKNILGTPGIESFIYHRLVDHPDELKLGLGCGLWHGVNQFKPSWELFCYVNRKILDYPKCGFEFLPYIELVNAYSSKYQSHYVSTRNLPKDFTKQNSFKINREKDANEEMVMAYECRVGDPKGTHSFISTDPNCENQFNMGPMGYLYKNKVKNSIPIYRCIIKVRSDHFISSDPKCEGKGVAESLVGYGFKV